MYSTKLIKTLAITLKLLFWGSQFVMDLVCTQSVMRSKSYRLCVRSKTLLQDARLLASIEENGQVGIASNDWMEFEIV